MTTQSRLWSLLALLALFTFAACDDEEGGSMNPEELITTVELTLQAPSGPPAVFTWADTDGAGGNAPEIDDITLDAGTVYTYSVRFLDESNALSTEDITVEVREEAEEHLVCLAFGNGVFSDGVNSDFDADGQPLGLEGSLTTSANPATGTLQITLQHEPDKMGDNPCTTGETDIEVEFPVTVQ
jgi:hypothetical protein